MPADDHLDAGYLDLIAGLPFLRLPATDLRYRFTALMKINRVGTAAEHKPPVKH